MFKKLLAVPSALALSVSAPLSAYAESRLDDLVFKDRFSTETEIGATVETMDPWTLLNRWKLKSELELLVVRPGNSIDERLNSLSLTADYELSRDTRFSLGVQAQADEDHSSLGYGFVKVSRQVIDRSDLTVASSVKMQYTPSSEINPQSDGKIFLSAEITRYMRGLRASIKTSLYMQGRYTDRIGYSHEGYLTNLLNESVGYGMRTIADFGPESNSILFGPSVEFRLSERTSGFLMGGADLAARESNFQVLGRLTIDF